MITFELSVVHLMPSNDTFLSFIKLILCGSEFNISYMKVLDSNI